MTKVIVLNAVIWICFYALHSFLAHNSTKRYIYGFGNSLKRYYRLAYNFISVIFFGFNIYVMTMTDNLFSMQSNVWFIFISIIFLVVGLAFLFIAFSVFDTSEFLGIEQLDLKENKDKTSKLINSGVYNYVRHPLYTGILFLLLGLCFLFLSPLIFTFAFVSIFYLPIGIFLEEKKLISEFGQQYVDYKKKVKMLIPFIF